MTYKGITRAALAMDAVILTNGYRILGNVNMMQANVQCVGVNCEDLVEYPKIGVYAKSKMMLSPPHN